MKKRLFFSLALLGMLLLTGITSCKVSYSFSGGKLRDGIETISIERFENDAQIVVPSLSQDFTEALKDRFISQTNLRMVTSAAHMQFSGSITNYNVAPVAIQGDDVAATNRLTITVKVKYENTLYEDENWDKTFSQFADFSSDQNLADIETELITQINEQLTLDIFNKVLANW